MFESLLGIARQWSREKFAILTLKPRSHVRILLYRMWAIGSFLDIIYARLLLNAMPTMNFTEKTGRQLARQAKMMTREESREKIRAEKLFVAVKFSSIRSLY